MGADAAPELVDWALAERVAASIGGRSPIDPSVRFDLESATVRAQELVTEFTGLHPPGPHTPARALVLDRAGWVKANIGAFRRLLSPLTDRFGPRMANSSWAPVQARAAGVETGLLLGYMSRRVLGQYDLLVPSDGAAGGSSDAVYYVGPNILGLERRFQLRPRDFRLWIALHELTHWSQFRAVSWMRPHFLSLVERALTLVDPDPKRLTEAFRRGVGELRRGRNPFEGGGILAVLASPDQLAVLQEAQSFMSLLEGHGNYVMNSLGRLHVVGHERMARHLETRRRAGTARQFHKLLGLDLKMRQYETGERFVTSVVDRAGFSALDRLWLGPEQFPGAEELEDPGLWLARVGV